MDRCAASYAALRADRRAEPLDSEIEGDMAQAAPMLRLLQGDVGSGKTVVALEAMLLAVEAGAQAALLAPTEILARQHHATLSRMLSGTGVEIALLTGRDKGRARESILMGLVDGSIQRWSSAPTRFSRMRSLTRISPWW
jgi:RecG-like helicase